MTQSNLTRRHAIGGAVTLSLSLATAACAPPKTVDDGALMEYFLNFSEAATGFSRADLESTGQGGTYFTTVRDTLGSDTFAEFLQVYHGGSLETLFGCPKHGPIARNIIKLWYTAMWERLPNEWQDTYGKISNDSTFIVSADAYTTSLLWPAVGVTPPGANAPGYGTWSNPPTRT